MQAIGPLLRCGLDAGGLQKCFAQPGQLRVLGHGRKQRHGLRPAHLVQQQLRQCAITSLCVVQRWQVQRGQQQLVQQRCDDQCLAMCACARRGLGCDVEAARAHPLHAHLVALAGGYPHTAIGRDDPGAVVSLHLHQARHAVQHLRAPVGVAVQQGAGGVVGADGQQRPVNGVNRYKRDVVHGSADRAVVWPKYKDY